MIIVDARLDPDAQSTVLSHLADALCLGVTVLTGAPISDALQRKFPGPQSALIRIFRWSGAVGTPPCSPRNACSSRPST